MKLNKGFSTVFSAKPSGRRQSRTARLVAVAVSAAALSLTVPAVATAEPVTVIPGADHFFHGKLHLIRKLIAQRWSPL